MEIIDVLIGIVSGGALTTLVTLPQLIKKGKAENIALELENMDKINNEWENIANRMTEEVKRKEERTEYYRQQASELSAKIDALYVEIGQWRDRYNNLQEDNTALRVKIATDEVKLCFVRGCKDREPQSGY